MPGKHCDGKDTNQPLVKNSQAFCEGQRYRRGGTALQRPISSNPYPTDSQGTAAADWDRGWNKVNDKAGEALTASDVGCCDGRGLAVSA